MRIDTPLSYLDQASLAGLRAGSAIFLIGMTLGLAVWSLGASSLCLLLIPLLWAVLPARKSVWLFMMGYYLASAHDVPMVVSQFFATNSIVLGVAIWIGHAAILAVCWSLLWSDRTASPLTLIVRFLLLLLVITIPPVGSISWVSPLLVAGDLFPGLGYWGILGIIALYVFLILTLRYRKRIYIAFSVALLTIGLALHFDTQPPSSPDGWVGINTAYGAYPTDTQIAYQRQQMLIMTVHQQIEAGKSVIVLPEEVVGLWHPSTQYWWTALANEAGQHGATILLGADVQDRGKKYRDGVLIFGAQTGLQVSRQPIPFGLWRPWSEEGALTHLQQKGTAKIGGHTAMFSFCYEDLLLWPALVSMLDHPDVIVSVANDWFAREGMAEPVIQARSIRLIARLFGVPLVRALNSGRRADLLAR